MPPVNSWTWWCGCSLTAGPAGRAVYSPLCYHQLCASVHVTATRHVTPPPASVSVPQQPADHHRRLLLLVPSPWSRWVVIKAHLTLISRELSLLWISQLDWVFILFYHLFSSDLCSLTVFSSLSSSAFYLTSSDWDRWVCQAQLFGWMMYHQGSGLQSGHVLFCYNNISTVLTYLIYSSDLLQGQRERSHI